jgi:hypothetical protein
MVQHGVLGVVRIGAKASADGGDLGSVEGLIKTA